MARILLIQSREHVGRIADEQAAYRRVLGAETEIVFESALNAACSWDSPQDLLVGIDGVILGGSGDLDFDGGRAPDDAARVRSRELVVRLESFIMHAFDKQIPVFGVCFGHQIIAEMFGGTVTNDSDQKKTGTFNVNLTTAGAEDLLFSTLPQTFPAHYAHKDSVTVLPSGAVLLATGERCRFSALRYNDKAYTTQFHPELKAQSLIDGLANDPAYLPPGTNPRDIIWETPEAESIFTKWMETVVGA